MSEQVKHLKKGDKLLCIKKCLKCGKGNYYKIKEIHGNIVIVNGFWFQLTGEKNLYNLFNFFITNKQLRKNKLKKIENRR